MAGQLRRGTTPSRVSAIAGGRRCQTSATFLQNSRPERNRRRPRVANCVSSTSRYGGHTRVFERLITPWPSSRSARASTPASDIRDPNATGPTRIQLRPSLSGRPSGCCKRDAGIIWRKFACSRKRTADCAKTWHDRSPDGPPMKGENDVLPGGGRAGTSLEPLRTFGVHASRSRCRTTLGYGGSGLHQGVARR